MYQTYEKQCIGTHPNIGHRVVLNRLQTHKSGDVGFHLDLGLQSDGCEASLWDHDDIHGKLQLFRKEDEVKIE